MDHCPKIHVSLKLSFLQKLWKLMPTNINETTAANLKEEVFPGINQLICTSDHCLIHLDNPIWLKILINSQPSNPQTKPLSLIVRLSFGLNSYSCQDTKPAIFYTLNALSQSFKHIWNAQKPVFHCVAVHLLALFIQQTKESIRPLWEELQTTGVVYKLDVLPLNPLLFVLFLQLEIPKFTETKNIHHKIKLASNFENLYEMHVNESHMVLTCSNLKMCWLK